MPSKLTELNASALRSSHRLTASGRPPPTIRARIPTRARAREGEGTRTDGQRSVESVCISDDGKPFARARAAAAALGTCHHHLSPPLPSPRRRVWKRYRRLCDALLK